MAKFLLTIAAELAATYVFEVEADDEIGAESVLRERFNSNPSMLFPIGKAKHIAYQNWTVQKTLELVDLQDIANPFALQREDYHINDYPSKDIAL